MSEIVDQTKKALQLLNLTEFKEGGKYIQLSCPFWKETHGKPDRNPSFVLYPEFGRAKCYSCGYKSSLSDFFNNYAGYIKKDINFDFLKFYVYLDFDEASSVENVILNEEILDCFSKEQAPIKKYLASREEPIDINHLDFPLYFDFEFKNLVCPVRDFEGNLFGATGRNTSGSAHKHNHYFGMLTSKSLLGLEHHTKKKVLIVEGLTDYLNCKAKINQLDLDYDVVATLTCSMDQWQANQIVDLGKPAYLCWDMDKAANNKKPQALDKLVDCIDLYDVGWETKNDRNEIKDIGDFSLEEFKELLD